MAMQERDARPTLLARQPRKKRRRFRLVRAVWRRLRAFPVRVWVLTGFGCAIVLLGVTLLVLFAAGGKPASKPLFVAEASAPAVPDTEQTPAPTPQSTPTATASPTPNPLEGITIGTVGTANSVLPQVQERLTALGYLQPSGDGYTDVYGPATKIAVLLFQMKNFLDPIQWDGQLGAVTYAMLMDDAAKAYYLGRGDGDDRSKFITTLVDDVKKLQDRLIELGYLKGITRASGYFGQSMADAVQTFQQYHGLTQDGRAEQETLALLYSPEAMDAKVGKQNDRSHLAPTPTPMETPAA